MDGKSIWMDYNEIKNQVVQQNKDDVSASEIYENVMKKEDERIELLNRIATNESKHCDFLYGALFSAELERQQTVPTSHCERSIPRQRLGSRVSQSRRVS